MHVAFAETMCCYPIERFEFRAIAEAGLGIIALVDGTRIERLAEGAIFMFGYDNTSRHRNHHTVRADEYPYWPRR